MIQKEVLPLKVVELLVPIYVKSEIRKGHRHGPVRSKFFSPLQVKSGDKKKKNLLKVQLGKNLRASCLSLVVFICSTLSVATDEDIEAQEH